jgi:uncharacterized protein (DUF58 family)
VLTRKSGLTVAFALWVFALGLLLGNGTLLLASVPIVTYIALMRITQPRPHLGVSVERSSEADSIYEGEKAWFTLRVQNNGPSISSLELLDSLPPNVRLVDGSNRVLTSLGRGEARAFRYSVRAAMFGSYDIGPIRLRATDLGRNRVEEKTLGSHATLWVYPDIRYVSRMTIGPHKPRNWPGETVARRAGSGIDFYGVKDYASGDSLRRVNWKASSRSQEILINQFLDESGGDILVVLDSRSVSEVGSPPDSLLTHSTRAAAAIAYRLLRDRNRVGLIGMGNNLVNVPPGFGKRQFERILVSLLTLRAGDGWAIENLPRLLSLRFSRHTQIVLISPVMDDRSSEAVVRTSTAGYNVILISPSPLGLERSRGSWEERLAERLVRLKRETQLSSLRRYVAVVDWNTSEPLGDAVYRLVEPRQR